MPIIHFQTGLYHIISVHIYLFANLIHTYSYSLLGSIPFGISKEVNKCHATSQRNRNAAHMIFVIATIANVTLSVALRREFAGFSIE